ncbi:MAG: histidinol-phosphatase, partial [Okeania sp. SIO4D6]|nr:histidinol-phosphatase [Okeania sp. SIO4D6]
MVTDDKAGDGSFDPVTEADRAAERVMRDILDRERPDDGILGEEFGTKPG